ncbi:lasso peptide biosynthesis PqqD family chaperone [Metabacillus idriensis]|uniref:lasso peptide biosynthesis PqqD family chaperone n=1 Tax=Metabacillus idriensis TaxID=324768 RepID=UPI003D28B515
MQTFNLELQSIVCQKPGFIVSDMDGDKVMMSVENGKYYSLGYVGGDIWDIISEPIVIEKIIEKITSSYKVEAAQCKEQVVSFLSSLHKEHLIIIKN